MLKKVKKDKKLRSKFFLKEQSNSILKSLIKNQNLSKYIAWNSGFSIINIMSKYNKNILVNRCVYSGRNNKIHSYYRFSRISFLHFVRNCFLALELL